MIWPLCRLNIRSVWNFDTLILTSLIGFGSQREVWQYKVLILRWIKSSIFDKGDTELVDNTLPFAGKRRWYNSLMPWKTKAEPWFDGILIRKIGERLTQSQCPQGRHSSLTLRLYFSWSGYLPFPDEHLHWIENVRGLPMQHTFAITLW